MDDSPRQRYEDIQAILQQAILRDYPNPERKGCPGNAVLRTLANRPRPVRDNDWEHVTHCSPCYREFLEYRSEVLRREHERRRFRWVIAAAIIVAAVGLSVTLLRTNRGGQLVQHQPSPSPPGPDQTLISAVLNLESQSATRGTQGQGVGEIQRLPKGRVALSVYLPFGSEPGQYEVRLLHDETQTTALATYSGVAAVEKGLTVLRLTVDFTAVPSGTYVLAIRHQGASWRYFRIAVG